jgi:hypothetical protein
MVVHRFELRATVGRIMRLLLRPNLDPDAEQPVERPRRPAEEAPPALAGDDEDAAADEPPQVAAQDGGSPDGDELRQ